MKQVELSPDKGAILHENGCLEILDYEYIIIIRLSGYETEELRKLLTQPNTNENTETSKKV